MSENDGKMEIAKVDRQLAALASLPDLKAALREVLRDELPRLLADLRPAANDADRLLGVDEAAQRLGLGTSTVYKLAERCELPSVKVGARVLFRPADLDAYAEARRRSPGRVRKLADDAVKKAP